MWVLQGQIGFFLNPNDYIYHMRSLFQYSTKNEDFFPITTFSFFGEISLKIWKNENVVMGKNLHFWSKIFKGPHMTENIIWVKENPNLAL